MENTILLPEDNKLLRLKSCDFFLDADMDYIHQETFSQITGTLHKIFNPILILFYYNTTSSDILTEFFHCSRNTGLEKGKKEDFMIHREIKDSDLEFVFGSVNLDYETELLKTLENISKDVQLGHPFKWISVKSGSEDPFILFYYQTLPQLVYGGVLNKDTVKNEFTEWYPQIVEKDRMNKEEKEKFLQDGYYMAVSDSPPGGWKDDNNNEMKWKKGDIFKFEFTTSGDIEVRSIEKIVTESPDDKIFDFSSGTKTENDVITNFRIVDSNREETFVAEKDTNIVDENGKIVKIEKGKVYGIKRNWDGTVSIKLLS